MFDDFGGFLMQIVAGLPGLIIAMTVHEYAHAVTAVMLGDPTPRMQGRLTLNPSAHIDPIGLLMLFLVRFGWAKPVMVNPYNFKHPRRDDILVSLAGPFSNLLTAFITLVIMVILLESGVHMTQGMHTVFSLILIYNINFAIFNMLPIPPLDGSQVLRQLLPYELAQKYREIERYSFLILIVFLMTPILGDILVPMQRFILQIFQAIIGIFF